MLQDLEFKEDLENEFWAQFSRKQRFLKTELRFQGSISPRKLPVIKAHGTKFYRGNHPLGGQSHSSQRIPSACSHPDFKQSSNRQKKCCLILKPTKIMKDETPFDHRYIS